MTPPSAGEDAPEQEKKSSTQYTAQATSPIVNGEVKLTIGRNAFTASALFETAEIPFVKADAVEFADYTVTVRTDEGNYAFSRMGSWAQPFFNVLSDAFSKAMLRAFFVSGNPSLKAEGDYSFEENCATANGKAPIHVYENCIVVLPPNSNARRIPLCFVNGIEKSNYDLRLTLSTGENYTFSKLGYETVPFADAAEKFIRALREKSIAAVKEIDPSLTAAQASHIAKLMPEGVTASVGQLKAVAPSFTEAVETKIARSRAAESYKAFKELCDPAQIWVGFMKNDADPEAVRNVPGGSMPDDAVADGMVSDIVAPPDPYLFWMIAPSPNGQYAAVEFAVRPGESAATFVYRTAGDFSKCTAQLNRALEAISFRREVIRLTNEELLKPDNADYYMAAKRTASLGFIRENFAGRVIHSSPESWKRKLTELWTETSAQPRVAQKRFCTACGAELSQDKKFCGNCGANV